MGILKSVGDKNTADFYVINHVHMAFCATRTYCAKPSGH